MAAEVGQTYKGHCYMYSWEALPTAELQQDDTPGLRPSLEADVELDHLPYLQFDLDLDS